MMQGVFTVTKASSPAAGFYDFTIHCPEMARQAVPGQFLHILCGEKTLRRPISICEIDAESLRIVFEVRGEGTAILAQVRAGDTLDILGPCGNGFPKAAGKRALVIGGGIGTPPLLAAAKEAASADAILGFRNAGAVILADDFRAACAQTFVTTDDGSHGEKGFVTDVLARLAETERYDVIYACGPMVMLRKIARIAAGKQIECYVSLEERMGCGVGACLVCACAIQRAAGETSYLHVCKDGPVFPAKEVVFA